MYIHVEILHFNFEPKTHLLDLLGVVYLFPCKNFDSAYTDAETGRTARIRLTEHRCTTEKCDFHSKFVIYVFNNNHVPNFDKLKILKVE